MLLTSGKPFLEWTGVFDKQLALCYITLGDTKVSGVPEPSSFWLIKTHIISDVFCFIAEVKVTAVITRTVKQK